MKKCFFDGFEESGEFIDGSGASDTEDMPWDSDGNGTDQQARQQSAHTKGQAEHHGSDHSQYGRADRGPQCLIRRRMSMPL